MTQNEKRDVRKLIAILKKAANLADSLELCVGNGGEVGSIVGGIADELECKLHDAESA